MLPPCCPAVGASKELRGRFVCTSRLDEPIKGFVITALWTISFRFGKRSNLLLLFAQNDYVLSFVGEPVNHLVTSATCIATLYACHEHFLLQLGGKKSGTTLWTKLQKLVSTQRRLSGEFILYPEISEKSWSASRWATLRGSGNLPIDQEAARILFKTVDSSRVLTHSRPVFPRKDLYSRSRRGSYFEIVIVGSPVIFSNELTSRSSFGLCSITALSSEKYAESTILLARSLKASFRFGGNEITPSK